MGWLPSLSHPLTHGAMPAFLEASGQRERERERERERDRQVMDGHAAVRSNPLQHYAFFKFSIIVTTF